ncbi:MAG: hypothetical protein KJ963_06860 [Bacteroidetes bacterium]|nr:hypothetical protein [Bacteroidota bacterium]MBU2636787.1 hypothetical protein [Bacteroidota bacterium]
MNKVIIFLLFIFLIAGCNKKYEEDETEKAQEAYDKKVQEELNSGIRNDTIFLGYTFGMTKNQAEKKTKELYKQHILYINDDNYYAYEMSLEKDDKAEATFAPSYFKNRLNALTVDVKPKGYFARLLYNPGLLQITLVNLYVEKYGYSYIKQEGAFDNDYIFIQGNREIKVIQTIKNVRIFYTDLSIQNEVKKFQDEESDKNVNDTKSNL